MKPIFVAFLLLFVSGVAHADLEVVQMAERIPVPIEYRSAAFDGNDGIYLLGGFYNEDRTLWRFSITRGTVDAVGAERNCYSDQAVWAGDHEAFCLNRVSGGRTELWGRRPTAPTTSAWLAATAPVEMYISKLVWDGGENVYMIGGYEAGTDTLDTILKYNKANGTLAQVATLPTALEGISAIWATVNNTEEAYIFGGFDSKGGMLDEIVLYDAATQQAVGLAAHLPEPRADSCAVWTGQEAYILGGIPFSNEIIRFTPGSNRVESLPVSGMPLVHGTACQFVPSQNRIYIFGGRGVNGKATADIYYIELPRL